MRIVECIINRQRIAWLDPDRSAKCRVILFGEISAEAGVLLQSIPLGPCSDKPDCGRFVERNIDHRGEAHGIEIAIAGAGFAMEAVGLGLGRNQIDRAAGCVAAIECALRSAQYFDPLKIVRFKAATDSRADIDPV